MTKVICLKSLDNEQCSPGTFDSGSPAFIEETTVSGLRKARCVYGIHTNGPQRCDGSGAFYMRVSRFKDWVQEKMEHMRNM